MPFARLRYATGMRYHYPTIYNKNADFLQRHPRLKKVVLFYNATAVYLFGLAYFALWGHGIFSEKFAPRAFVRLFFALTVTLLCVSVLRATFDRPRPYGERGAGITPLREKKRTGASFPSRHVACASVVSACFAPFFPAVSVLLWLLTIALGYARFAIGWHYPSDLFGGFVLGSVVGCISFFI